MAESKKNPTARKEYPIPPPGKIGLSLAETCRVLGVGMTTLRQSIEQGLLPARRLGKKIIVRRPDADSFLLKLPSGPAKRVEG